MKIIVRVLLITVLYTCLFSSCGMKPAEEPLVVYSFSGENEMFSISNGVIVLNEGKQTTGVQTQVFFFSFTIPPTN